MSTQDQINQVNNSITIYQGQLVDLLNTLAQFRPASFTPSVQTPPTMNDVSPITVGALTPLGPLTGIGGTNPNNNPYSPLLAGILSSLQYTKPEIDASAGAAFIGQVNALNPTLFTWLYGQIEQIVTTGGQDISSEIQDAINNTAYERDLQAFNDSLQLAGAMVGGKGARMPNSAITVLHAQVAQNYQNARSDTSRKILEAMGNLAQSNLREAISAGVQIDHAIAAIFTQQTNALIRIQELILEEYKTDALENFQIFESYLRLQMTDLEVQKADRDEMRAWIGEMRDQIRLASQVTIAEFEVGNKLQVLQVDVQKYIADLVIKKNEQAVAVFEANVKQFAELQQIVLQEILENNRLQQDLLKSTASTFAELIQSMAVQAVEIATTSTTA